MPLILSGETQPEVEALMSSMGVQRYDAAATRASKVSELQHGSQLLTHLVSQVEAGLNDWIIGASTGRAGRWHHAVKFLAQVDAGVASFLAARMALDRLTVRDNTERTLAYAIGAAIEEEAQLLVFRRECAALWKGIARKQKHAKMEHKRKVFRAAAGRAQLQWEGWKRKDKTVVGLVMLHLIEEHTALLSRRVTKTVVNDKFKSEVFYTITEDALAWLDTAAERCAARLPVLLPCVDPPMEWSNNWDGGYFGFGKPLMMQRPAMRTLTDDLTAGQVPVLFRGVNATQATPWAVNDDVFQVADYFWDLGTPVAGFPDRDNEQLPAKPPNIDEDEKALKTWKKAAHLVHCRNAERVGRRMLVTKTLDVARLFQDVPCYFPQKLDFRSRMYPVPNFLTPQGADLGKALLTFADSKEDDSAEAGEWLSVHGANCYGDDKLPWDERKEWAHRHRDNIVAVASNPLDNRWWADADEPWQFLAWCLDYANWMQTGESSIPVAMDGSNNGLQIFSLMLRDPVGAKATNVLPGDTPCDIYQDVADITMVKLRQKAAMGEPWAKQWLGFLGAKGLNRKAVKRAVMTLPYGVKQVTARDYVRDWYREVNPYANPLDDPLAPHIFDLADLIWDSIADTVPRAVEAMGWLQDVAARVAGAGKPLVWRTPIGTRIGQVYFKSKTETVRTTLGEGVRRKCTYAVDGKTLDKRKMADSISPNLVHSLDASAMYLTIDKALRRGVSHFSMVHDSFATHAADAEALALSTREAYAELFAGNFLLDFKQQIEHNTGLVLPDPPEQGDLDPMSVIQSRYFFL